VQIVRRGAPTPDANGSFLDFNFKGTDTLPFNNSGQAAFLATLTGTSSGTADNLGIFRGDGSMLVRVVRKGQAAPNADGSFSDFDQPAINAAGQVVFHATLTGTTKTQGIFLYDDVKGLIQVVRQGDPLLGSSVAAMGFAPDSSFGRTHVGVNASGQVAFQFGLADGRVGVAVWSPGSSTTTTTTLAGPPTTTTTVVGTSSTTSTTVGGRPTPTTTTLPPCTTVRCTIDAARNGSSCTGQTPPPGATKKLAVAINQTELAPSQTPKRAKRLYKSAGHLLTSAGKLVARAARGRHPKLSTGCATDLGNAIHQAAGRVGSSR
jgi:hypothetical protein